MRNPLKFRLFRVLPAFLRRRFMIRRYDREVNDWGEAELAQLRNLLSPGELALDVGCNLGAYTYELSRLTGRVVAFEPNPMLADLVARLGLPGVEVRQVALSSRDGMAELLVPTGSGGRGLASLRSDTVAGRMVEKVAVPTRRLDGLALQPVAFIKIDVEGYEEEVLAGAMQTIARDRPKLLMEIEERHNPGGLARIRARLEAIGYSGRFFRGGAWHPLDAFNPAVDQRVGEDIEELGKSILRRDYHYINNFLFVPAD